MPASKKARDIFLVALECPLAARNAYLDKACGDDIAVRQRVEALLRAHDEPGAFLSEATPGANATAEFPVGEPVNGQTATFGTGPAVTTSFPGRDEKVGAILGGKYKLIEEVGEGGMGSVFMAQQTEPVKRAVAVKVIKAGMDSKAVLARFEAERQALAMMDHPNIAKVFDAATTESGRPYFVMELVKGKPITQFCDERKLTPKQRLELFIPVCNAIQHAHQKGIIHRDIKPGNVLVAMYDDRPVPKVIDFGVAKAAGQSLTDKTHMTGFGAVIGTPEYMSPEQANLNNLDIDTRSDVYSLGVLLYELLTGTTPVDRKSLGRAALLEILRIVREVEAPRLSDKLSTIDTLPSIAANRGTEPAKLSKLMKGELDWVLLKALEKDRARRYDTANGFARDIQRYLSNETVVARPPTASYRFQKSWQRNKLAYLALTAIAFSLVFGIAISVWQAIRADREARRVIVTLNELRATAPAFVEQARAMTAKEQFDEAIAKLDYASNLRPDEPEYLITKANLLQCQFRFQDASVIYRAALTLRPGDSGIIANVTLCEELQAATSSTGGQLNRERLSQLLMAMQKDNRSAAELMPVSRLLGEEKKLVVAYWLERLKGLPIAADKPLAKRLTVRDDGLLSLDLSGTKVLDLTPLDGAPLGELNLTGVNELVQIQALRGMKLKTLSLSGTKVNDLSPLQNMQSLVKLEIKNTPVESLAALSGIPLKQIEMTGCPIRDLAPLRGAPVEHLGIMDTRITSLSPLVGMPLKFLDMGAAPVTDFSPLRGLPLEVCNLPGCTITDLSVLENSPIRELMVWNCPSARNYAVLSRIQTLELLILPAGFRLLPGNEVASIEALRKHPKLKQLGTESSFDHTTTGSVEAFWKDYDKVQTYLAQVLRQGAKPNRFNLLPDGTLDIDFSYTPLTDLSIFHGLPVSELWLADTPVADLTPIQNLPLKKLLLFNTRVTDLKPLTGMRLEYINLVRTKVSDISALSGMPLTSVRLNGCDELKDITALRGCTTLRELTLPEKAVNFEFLRTLPNLQRLSWYEDGNNGWRPTQTVREFWQDQEQFTYTKSIEKSGFAPKKISGGWSFQDKPIENLAILQGQPIRSLHLGGTKVTDLKPLKGMPLRELWLFNTPITDLSPLAGMALEHLNLNSTGITDISVLRGMPLVILRFTRCSRLEDITPLSEIKTLEELTLPPKAKNIETLRNLPNLKRLSYYEDGSNSFRPETTTAEFWARFDRMKAMARFNAENLPELPQEILAPADAVQRLNETVAVRFTVRGSGKSRDDKWYFLNSLADFRKPDNFTIAIQDPNPMRLKQLGIPEKYEDMVGKTVVGRGKVGTFSGRPQIVISDVDWVWIVEDK